MGKPHDHHRTARLAAPCITTLLAVGLMMAWAPTAEAGLICMKAKVKGGKIKWKNKAMLAAPCPDGYSPFLHTDNLGTEFPGPKGEMGPVGPQGGVGDTGARGPVGPAGPAGPEGPRGKLGTVGPRGATGPAGLVGPQGPKGKAGPPGADGGRGPAGPKGDQGPRGRVGAEGPAGPAGAIGPRGLTGPAGAPGDFARVVVVKPKLGDPVASGKRLRAAVDGIDDARANDPIVVWLEPGLYALGSLPLVLPPFVHLQGWGPEVSIIEAGNAAGSVVVGRGFHQIRGLGLTLAGGKSAPNQRRTIDVGDGQMQLADAIVRCSGAGSTCVGVSVSGGLVEVRDTAILTGGSPASVGIDVGGKSSAVLTNVEIQSTSFNTITVAVIRSGVAVLLREAATVFAVGSSLTGDRDAVSNPTETADGDFVSTRLAGGILDPNRQLRCIAGYDNFMSPLSPFCQLQ